MEIQIDKLNQKDRNSLARFIVDEMDCKLKAADEVRNPEECNLHKVTFILLPKGGTP